MYIRRHIEDTIKKAEKSFGAVLVTGSRQVGKSTLLKNTYSDLPYLTLDDPMLLAAAVEEAGIFFKITPPPIIVDEIQYAPNLFPYIKMYIDSTNNRGQFFLSGSQQFQMMKNVSESLAGRVGILTLMGFSLRELNKLSFNKPFLPTNEYFSDRKKELAESSYHAIWEYIHKGSMPAMYVNEIEWEQFYSSYTKTYIERDVRALTQVGDEIKFLKFMTAIASCTGQLLNQASIARDVGVSQPTIERWLSILRASNLIYLLQPYHNNITKRAIKTPKVYFLDTGLAAYLTRWNTADVLQNGAMAGAFFETFVISEIIKSYTNVGREPSLYFYRDKEQNEIDLIIFQDGTLYPLEIKKHADPKREDISTFKMIESIVGAKRGTGGVICMYDKLLPLTQNDMIIPVSYL